MKGDLYIDFSIAAAMFILVFVSIFYFFDSQSDIKIQNEEMKIAEMKINGIFDSLPMEKFMKRVVYLESGLENEFVGLSGYQADIVLDEDGDSICIDTQKDGFLANTSENRIFYIYSTESVVNRNICQIGSYSNKVDEEISSPVYEYFFTRYPEINSTGDLCENRKMIILSGEGLEEKDIRICA